MSTVATGSRWWPTATLVRAGLASATLAVAAVALGRPDLLVLASPLLVHAVAALRRRPVRVPSAVVRTAHPFVREGEGTTLTVRVDGAEDVEHTVVALHPHPHVAPRPASGVVGAADPTGSTTRRLEVAVAGLRWGRRTVGDGLVGATSAWAGWTWGPVPLDGTGLTVLPQPGSFDSRTPSPHPIGLVGQHPARRRGDGSELESIRPFQPGDRLRRVHWRVSLRTGSLHVTSTVAEEDASVLLLVDCGVEVGRSGGVHGRASTLDVAVRAAAAVAEHHLTRGDRVGLRLLGGSGATALRSRAGRRHLRRVLGALAAVVPGEDRDVDPDRLRLDVPAGSIVLVFSPMLGGPAVAVTTLLASRGLDVVVVDCLPPDLDAGDADDERLALAWRMRRLERDALLVRVRRAGIPVVPWRGPGTLDEVLRRIGRRSSPVGGALR